MPATSDLPFYLWEAAVLLGGLVLIARLLLQPELRRKWLTTTTLPTVPFSIADVMMFLWMILTGGYVAHVFVQMMVIGHLKNVPESETWQTLAYGTSFHLGSLFGCLCFQYYLQKKFGALSDQPTPTRPTLSARARAGIITFVTIMPVLLVAGYLWTELLHLLHLPTDEQDLIGLFAQTKSPRLLWTLIVLAIVVAPINEELIFRAGVYRFARARLPRTAAIVLSAVLFATMHWNLVSFIPLVLLGCAFALAYEKTGRIEVSMIAHGLFNLNTILLIFAGLN